MTARAQQDLDALAALLRRYLDGGGATTLYSRWPHAWRQQSLAAAEIAQELLAYAEDDGVRLGTWLDTPNGAIIARAVELALPVPYRQQTQLLVEALTLAARQQQQGERRTLAGVALLVVAAAVIGTLVARA